MSQSNKHLPSILVKHNKNTASQETEVMPIPELVKIGMSQHIGAPCKPLVKKGDYVKVGQKIGDIDAFVSAPIHSSVSGTVVGIEEARGNMGGIEKRIVIEADKKQEVSEEVKVPHVENHKEFVQAVRNSGMVGLGGASFPTSIKLDPKNLDECHTLIVNAAECEPYITADNRMMLEQGDDILAGMQLIMNYLELDKGYIAIEDNKPNAIENLDRMIKQQDIKNIETFKMHSRYPKGAERVLVYEVTGKVMNAGVLPAQLGVILDNVTTVGMIGNYFKTGMPLVRKRLTVDGDAILNPKNIFAPIGTSISDIVEFCGGYKKEPRKIVMGGPMMGRATLSDDVPIMKNTGSVLAFTKDKAEVKEETACINCGRCHEACPFGLMPQLFAEAYARKDVEKLQKFNIMQCIECGSCSFVCPTRRPLSFTNKLAKGLVKEATKK